MKHKAHTAVAVIDLLAKTFAHEDLFTMRAFSDGVIIVYCTDKATAWDVLGVLTRNKYDARYWNALEVRVDL